VKTFRIWKRRVELILYAACYVYLAYLGITDDPRYWILFGAFLFTWVATIFQSVE
jgi:hypothetical protein